MESFNKEILWSQFGAAIDMLRNAILECPMDLWNNRNRQPEFWYLAYHTLFWLDFYLTENPSEYIPREPFGITELDPAGILPGRLFTQDELIDFLDIGRTKCKSVINRLTTEKAAEKYEFGSVNLPFLELILYNMRHVQHHTAQMNLILRQQINNAPAWIKKVE